MKCTECPIFKDYEASLNDKQKEIYNSVKKERLTLYFKGLIVGSILAGLYLYNNKLDSYNKIRHSCVFVAIAMSTQYLVYQLAPKKVYMLNVLDKKEQIDKWLEVYKAMKQRYHLGMVYGLVGYYLLSYGLF
jgi:hypothetical protein